MTKFASITAAAAMAAVFSSSAVIAQETFVGFVSPVASQPGQAMASEIMAKMAADLGWEYRMLDSNGSPDRQVSHVDTLITLGANAITSWSIDPNAVAAAYARAHEQGIGIVGINSTGDGIDATVWWEILLCDDGGAFDQQVAWIKERRPDAKIILMGGPPVPSIQSMTQCFQDKAEAAGLQVVGRADNTKDTIASGSALASDLLVRYPDANVFWAYNDASALGISASVLASGKSVYAADGSEPVYQGR